MQIFFNCVDNGKVVLSANIDNNDDKFSTSWILTGIDGDKSFKLLTLGLFLFSSAVNAQSIDEAKKVNEEIIKNHNKGVEDESKRFKGLFGTELTLVDDTVNIVVRPKDYPLEHTTFVVFDTETTGFNAAGGDSIIEIGAVKLKDGEIIDKFDKLINDISEGLPAEIELRRKQYEYYRDKLLSFEVCNDE